MAHRCVPCKCFTAGSCSSWMMWRWSPASAMGLPEKRETVALSRQGAVTLLDVWVPDGVSGHGGLAVRACVQAVVGRPTAPVIWSQMAKRMVISARLLSRAGAGGGGGGGAACRHRPARTVGTTAGTVS